MKDEELLAEVEDLLRNMPNRENIWENNDLNISWLGRVSAFVEAWNSPQTAKLTLALMDIDRKHRDAIDKGMRNILILLHHARHSLRMKTIGPVNVVVDKGMVFDYFDEIRKIIESASDNVLFVDPYLDAEFVSRYMRSIPKGVNIRCLTKEKLKTLIPAVDAFVKQTNANIEIRSSTGLHDRFLFVDNENCYQSGASFKDGAKTSPTTLTQIIDAFSAIHDTYEAIWSSAKVEK